MKKLFNIMMLVAVTATAALTSCKNEVDDIFDKSAAERLTEGQEYFTNILSDKGGKWQMEYFANANEPGYVYVVTFNKDGSVKMAGNNLYIARLTNASAMAPAYGDQTSLWDVITDNGLTLTFNSYNRVFHLFSTPEDLSDTEASETGVGHEGDYEFNLMKYSNDTLYLTGKKRHIDIIMTRLSPEVDDRAYLDEVNALPAKYFNALIPDVFITLPNGARYQTAYGSTLIVSMAPEANETRTRDQDADWISYVEKHNAIITPGGLRFMEPITLYGTYEARQRYEAYWKENPEATSEPDIPNVYKVQTFDLQEDGSLLCREDGVSRIAADDLGKVFASYKIKWRVDLAAGEGELAEAISNFVSAMAARDGSTVQTLDFLVYRTTRDPATGDVIETQYMMEATVRRRRGGSFKMDFYYNPVVNADGTVKLVFDGTYNTNATSYVANVPAVQALVDAIGGATFTVTSTSRLAPVNITLTSGEGNYIEASAF
ncbi:MAG: DUF4302 domain-containing protein [Muribaculaceae bacterium]|nr:DUF4302 domain-containing protein [Muribaculaceae bacterium]